MTPVTDFFERPDFFGSFSISNTANTSAGNYVVPAIVHYMPRGARPRCGTVTAVSRVSQDIDEVTCKRCLDELVAEVRDCLAVWARESSGDDPTS